MTDPLTEAEHKELYLAIQKALYERNLLASGASIAAIAATVLKFIQPRLALLEKVREAAEEVVRECTNSACANLRAALDEAGVAGKH